MKSLQNSVNSTFLYMWWFPIFVVILVLVGTPLVLVPKVNQIIDQGNDLKRVSADLTDAEKKIEQLKLVDQDQMSQLFQKFRQALPPQKPYYEVLLLLQQLGGQTGVSIGDFELSPGSLATASAKNAATPTSDGYVALDTELTVSGTNEQVTDFVARLHGSMPLLMVSNISIDGKEDVKSANLAIKILYLPDKPASKTVSLTPLPPLSGTVDEVAETLYQYYDPAVDVGSFDQPVSDFSRTDIFNY